MRKLIFILFSALIFLVPLILWPFTSEVFEFNKIVLVYLLTALITSVWAIRCIVERKIIFSRTLLDIPLLIFLGSQIISTFLSIDPYISIFGYYSRFNGGLLSTSCYLLLYWAFVSNFNSKDVLKLSQIWLATIGIVALVGFGEHFKFFAVCAPIQYSQTHRSNADSSLIKKYSSLSLSGKLNYTFRTSCWVQDVQSRVFSTLGQPNWLAAWLVAVIPLCWAFSISNYQLAIRDNKDKKNVFQLLITNYKLPTYYLLSVLFFVTLLFTKSRSGLIGFLVADFIFWVLYFVKTFKNDLKKFITPFIIYHLSFGILVAIIGTQFTPSITNFINHQSLITNPQISTLNGTALETGGTESGTIRKIVWEGALDIWKHYPIFGTGVETFAYSYYLYRPIAHNVTSEWDFIYNKAHNEFLNFLANTGIVGFLSYLNLIVFSIILIITNKYKYSINTNSKLEIGDHWYLFDIGLLSGFISLSVSNFFGFSVVPTQLEFFLFPAFAFAVANSEQRIGMGNSEKMGTTRNVLIAFTLIATIYTLYAIFHYWHADILYSKAKAENSAQRPDLAIPLLTDAIRLEPNQAIYYGEQSISYSTLAMAYDQNRDATSAAQFTALASEQIQKAISLSPANINLRRQMFGIYVRLSTIDEKYLVTARDNLIETIKLAPTDPKLYFNLGIANANLGETQKAADDFQKAIELKNNYTDARIQYAALLAHLKQFNEAKSQLNYILTNIDPGNSIAKTALENIK